MMDSGKDDAKGNDSTLEDDKIRELVYDMFAHTMHFLSCITVDNTYVVVIMKRGRGWIGRNRERT